MEILFWRPNLFYWGNFLILYLVCFFSPFLLAVLHFVLIKKKIRSFSFFRIFADYFIFINIFLKSLILGVVRIYWGKQVALLDHLSYSHIFSEYGVLLLSISIFSFLSLFSNTSFRIAPSVFFGIFLILVSIIHWHQIEDNLLLFKSRYYLLIIFDLLTALVLFYHSWVLKKFVLSKEYII